jgi:hypothetical protein
MVCSQGGGTVGLVGVDRRETIGDQLGCDELLEESSIVAGAMVMYSQ